MPDGHTDVMPDAVPVEAGRHSHAKPDVIPTRCRTPFRRETGRRSDVKPDGYR
jgi:hypothetical protein